MSKKTTIVVMCLMGAVATMTASAETFPKDGKDLSNPVDWGNPATFPPTGNVRIDYNGTYNADLQDITFAGIWPNAAVVIDLTSTPNRTITLNGANIMYPYATSKSLELKGGVYNCSNKSTQLGALDNTRLTLSAGVCFTNVYTLGGRVSGKSGSRSLVIKDAGTRVRVKSISNTFTKDVAYNEDGTSNQNGVSVDISGGADVCIANTWNSDASFQNGGGWVLVRGEDTKLSVTGKYFRVGGASHKGCGLHITDRAVVTHIGTNFILQNDTTDYSTRVLVDNGGSLTVSGQMNIGAWSSSHKHNQLVAGPHGTIEVDSVYGLNANNRIICSNGTMRVSGNCLMDMSNIADGSGITITGGNTTFTCGGILTFNKCVMEWQLPDAPYETSGSLIKTVSAVSSGASYSISNVAGFASAIPKTTEVTLMEVTGGTLPEHSTAIEAVSAAVAAEVPGSSVYRAAGGKKLMLRVFKRRGFVINVE